MKLFIMLSLVISSSASAATKTIGTLDDWTTGSIGIFGEPNTATYGQTFIVPKNTTMLDNFSFSLKTLGISPGPVDFKGYVAAWDNDKIVGTPLWQSPKISVSPTDSFQQINFNVSGLPLQPKTQYVAFMSASEVFDGIDDGAQVATTPGTSYKGGQFVFSNNGSNLQALASAPWEKMSERDLAFFITFSDKNAPHNAPMPGLAMPFILLAGLLSFTRRLIRK